MLSTNWIDKIKTNAGVQSPLDEYFIISSNLKLLPSYKYPIKVERSMIIMCEQGELRFLLNMKECVCTESSIAIIPSDSNYLLLSFDDKLTGWLILLSEELDNKILSYINQRQTLVMSTIEQPILQLDSDSMRINSSQCQQLHNLVLINNPHIKEIITHTLMAFFYMQHPQYPTQKNKNAMSNSEKIFSRFTTLVEQHFKNERKVIFYANKMALTPKYLASVIKEYTGKSANEWIDDYVMLEAKALLRSSRLTVQQIAERLAFPDQSDFGKYFKSHQGSSPKSYRENTGD